MTIMVLAVAAAMAQAPEKFTYQAVVRNASNSLVANASVGVRVSILQGSATGSAVYSETHVATTNANGLVTLSIGGGNAQQGTFADIDWANGPFFLKSETDPNGGSNYSITTTQQMLSVPYALYAKEAGNIPTVPANVSAFTNDAGYITGYTETDPTVPAWAKEANKPTYNYSEIVNTPELPTVPTNVSAFTNDAGYLTNYTETDPTVPAWAKEANKPMYNYSEIVNTPTIPTVPTNVSAFTNDAGYLTNYTETDPTVPAWAKEATKPAYDYSEIANTPTIPAVPTNVSAFTNDAGYITNYTETDPQFNAWDKDYNDLINTPVIPTVPAVVSAFTNDAEYITISAVPTQVSAFNNDAQYITAEAIPTQVSAFNNDAQYITAEAVPTQVSAFENDAQYVTESELQLTVNVINNTFDTLDNTIDGINSSMDNMDNTIDSLRNRIEELEGNHTPPTVMTTGVSEVSYTTANLNGSVVYIGGAPVAARGFCYDTVLHPTVESSMVSCGSGGGSFSANLLNLNSSTTYYVRAYATNMWGTNYGEEKTFTTLTEYAPSVEIAAATDIDFTSFTCSGDVTDSGTYTVTARGFCYATTPDPVMTGEHVHLGNGIGPFSVTFAELVPETTYYVRAYAVNAVGVAYSNAITVTTLTPTLPTVTTDSVSSYNECFATVTSDGGAPVTQRGFCYDTLPNPTTESNVVFVGDGVGEFEAVLSGLPVGKLYFVKAFATNAKGTTYGNQFDFYAGCDSKTVTDYDGNVYNTVLIGTQCWMKENLRTTHYADGWPLENTQFKYPDNSADNVGIYGLLYNRNVAMRGVNESSSVPSGVQGICPDGWHLPSNGEWNQLTTYVNNQYEYRCNGQANTYAKALADSIGWDYNAGLADQYPCNIASGEGTNNATGFSARASGYIDGLNSYGFGKSFYCWSTSKVNSQGAIMYQIFKLDYRSHTAALGFNNGPRDTNPISVRCLRD